MKLSEKLSLYIKELIEEEKTGLLKADEKNLEWLNYILTLNQVSGKVAVPEVGTQIENKTNKNKEKNMAKKTEKVTVLAEEAYCLKCKVKQVMKNVQEVKMKNGRPMKKGVCTVCGTNMCKILPSKKSE